MKIAIASEGRDLTSEMGSTFGRCPVFLFVDTGTGAVDVCENGAQDASGGAGVEAARIVVERGAEIVIAPMVGPKAQDVLDHAGIRVHLHKGGTTGEALAAFQSTEAV
jgi:predicted Fe-Mo cluster-binding NifX family protein